MLSPGRAVIAVGVLIVIVGLAIEFVPWLRPGRLPGDLSFGSGNLRVFIPLGTSIALSIALTLLASLFFRR